MKRFLRATLPLAILGACGYAAWWFITHKPETVTMEAPPTVVRVEGTKLQRQTYPVRVRSQGTVQPRTRSTLLPEVAAKVLEVSPSFRPGGFFDTGEVLLKLDPVDYETALVVAKATLAQAEVVLAEETAKAGQARENWRALGKTGEPGALALRLPQVAKAEADVSAAKAQIAQAERDLERTVIRAPYDGQVLEQLVDVGQYVNEGTALGQIFAVDYVEIRLPSMIAWFARNGVAANLLMLAVMGFGRGRSWQDQIPLEVFQDMPSRFISVNVPYPAPRRRRRRKPSC
jgi:multidrug efflux system membrane fusion protein